MTVPAGLAPASATAPGAERQQTRPDQDRTDGLGNFGEVLGEAGDRNAARGGTTFSCRSALRNADKEILLNLNRAGGCKENVIQTLSIRRHGHCPSTQLREAVRSENGFTNGR